jgi:hypothetical protein
MTSSLAAQKIELFKVFTAKCSSSLALQLFIFMIIFAQQKSKSYSRTSWQEVLLWKTSIIHIGYWDRDKIRKDKMWIAYSTTFGNSFTESGDLALNN